MSVIVKPQIHLVWYPREDITVYELAFLISHATRMVRPSLSGFEQWPENFRKHFQIVYDPHDPAAVEWVEKYGVKQ